MMRKTRLGLIFVILLGGLQAAGAPGRETAGEKAVFDDPESLIRGLYAAVTFDPGTSPDWDYVKSFFIPEAVLAVRMTPTSMAVIGVEGFIGWWLDDIREHKMDERGFEESVETLKLTEYGHIAHCFVVYKAGFKTPAGGPRQRGLDSFELMKRDGRWWIVAVTNDVVSPDNPLPENLR